MSELVNVVVAIAFIALIVNWATSSKETPEEKNARAALGFRPKHVTSEMVSFSCGLHIPENKSSIFANGLTNLFSSAG